MRLHLRPFAGLLLAMATAASPAAAQVPERLSDIPAAAFAPNLPHADYILREAMVPMRDGVRLYTLIVMRKGASAGPMLLTRTPYNAASSVSADKSERITEIVPPADAAFVEDGYIRVYQDIRGKNRSEGSFVLLRPARGPLNPTATDESTDAYDTIDWLVHNVPESNGRVGIIGSSYGGFTALMALIGAHPALRAAVPQHPYADGWRGDDWFHNGAFRQLFTFGYAVRHTAVRGRGPALPLTNKGDAYEALLAAGSAGDFARQHGLEKLPFVQALFQHPAYDAYWQAQAVDKVLAAADVSTPTLLIAGQWDQEDIYGPPAVYAALKDRPALRGKLFLALGPWRHSGVSADEMAFGPVRFAGDTAGQFRREVMKPFLDAQLREGSAPFASPPIISYATGADVWSRSDALPKTHRPLYFQNGFGLGFTRPTAAGGADSYVSDPARPVPFSPRPFRLQDEGQWRYWLSRDQRFADGRTDVLTYVSPPLTEPLHIRGQTLVDLRAATSGTDADWVVKLIDVHPDENTRRPELAGYQLPIGIEIFRGRYRERLDAPASIVPGRIEAYRFALPLADHVFQPGHRIMVQVQSSLFPLYDRNPQTFVPNIFFARPQDYRPATQTISRSAATPSAILLPVVEP